MFVNVCDWAGFEHDTAATWKELAMVKMALFVPHVPCTVAIVEASVAAESVMLACVRPKT